MIYGTTSARAIKTKPEIRFFNIITPYFLLLLFTGLYAKGKNYGYNSALLPCPMPALKDEFNSFKLP